MKGISSEFYSLCLSFRFSIIQENHIFSIYAVQSCISTGPRSLPSTSVYCINFVLCLYVFFLYTSSPSRFYIGAVHIYFYSLANHRISDNTGTGARTVRSAFYRKDSYFSVQEASSRFHLTLSSSLSCPATGNNPLNLSNTSVLPYHKLMNVSPFVSLSSRNACRFLIGM